jgi:hypothetical protein
MAGSFHISRDPAFILCQARSTSLSPLPVLPRWCGDAMAPRTGEVQDHALLLAPNITYAESLPPLSFPVTSRLMTKKNNTKKNY